MRYFFFFFFLKSAHAFLLIFLCNILPSVTICFVLCNDYTCNLCVCANASYLAETFASPYKLGSMHPSVYICRKNEESTTSSFSHFCTVESRLRYFIHVQWPISLQLFHLMIFFPSTFDTFSFCSIDFFLPCCDKLLFLQS
jgi:hypothetical protein